MNKKLLIMVAAFTALLFTSCSSQPDIHKIDNKNECVVEDKVAPDWVCNPNSGYDEDLTDIGSASYNASYEFGFTRREAMAKARSNLVQQIKTDVKDKVSIFMEKTGLGEQATIDKVTTQLSKQVAKTSLQNSRQLKFWDSGKSLFVLVGVPKKSVNNSTVNNIKSSFNNDMALWQKFQATKAFEEFKKDFE